MGKNRVWLILVSSLVLFCACQPQKDSGLSNTPTAVDYWLLLPSDMVEFHMENIYGSLLIITFYKTPYQGSFGVIRLERIGSTLSSWVESPGFAHRSLVQAVIEEEEKNLILDDLYAVSHSCVIGNEFSSQYIITISINNDNYLSLMTCTEKRCPLELCELINHLDTAVNMQNVEFLNGLICTAQTPGE